MARIAVKAQILVGGLIALLAALGVGIYFARVASGSIQRLQEAARKVADGDFATPIPISSADELGQLARTFNEMQRRLARLDSARKEFIANASHELRTPIFSLGGFVELLEDEDPEPEARAEFVATMREQIERLTKLTADLLDLSQLDADAIADQARAVDLGRVAREVDARVRPDAPIATARELELRGASRAGGRRADPDRVRADHPYPARQRAHAHARGTPR